MMLAFSLIDVELLLMFFVRLCEDLVDEEWEIIDLF
jgi:hypothetical protein